MDQGAGHLIVEHPRELLDESPDKAIRICLERGSIHGFLDCDYGSVRVHPDGRGSPSRARAPRASPRWTPSPPRPPPPGRHAHVDSGPRRLLEPVVKPFDVARFQVPARGRFVPHVLEECT